MDFAVHIHIHIYYIFLNTKEIFLPKWGANCKRIYVTGINGVNFSKLFHCQWEK